MNTQILKNSREVLELILREKHDDIDSNTKLKVENLLNQINAELEGKTSSETTKRDILETFGVLLGVLNKGAKFVETILSILNP
ncbi:MULTISPECIES: hypothetical protein [Photobacterium]|uniref:DUF4404 domain-containing protein n=1 Tax=Photobacterium aquimaris TaxID=512643 RepID=A0A2T3I0S0_9GAMM|nr:MULTISPECIES: hypothetical protein [Photobacterium]MEC6817127.1 hypothetical protein [Photobacterium toruni]OBU25678.1 hypothetical protein AYY21_08835 [Photobacterium aquimaris]PQJ37026.1 hypothetical protein BTN98_17955 [Photobacterium aquimaris]PSU10119.1 hypothetical protein C0W81_05180 [Photobacterium aquimaris]